MSIFDDLAGWPVTVETVPGRGERIPVLSIATGKPGPAVVVTANLHGDEGTGVAVVHQLAGLLTDALLCGQVRLYPSLNPRGLRNHHRGLFMGRDGLNRAFPGSMRGSPTHRYANRLWAHLTQNDFDVLLDLHADSTQAIPYVILDRVLKDGAGSSELEDEMRRVAEQTGLTVVSDFTAEKYRRKGLDKSLPGAVVNHLGRMAMTLEVGPCRTLLPTAVNIMTDSVMGALGALHMVKESAAAHSTRVGNGPLCREGGPVTSTEGLLVPRCKPGDALEAGQVLGEVRSLEGGIKELLRAEGACFVLAWPDYNYVKEGFSVATLAVPD